MGVRPHWPCTWLWLVTGGGGGGLRVRRGYLGLGSRSRSVPVLVCPMVAVAFHFRRVGDRVGDVAVVFDAWGAARVTWRSFSTRGGRAGDVVVVFVVAVLRPHPSRRGGARWCGASRSRAVLVCCPAGRSGIWEP